MYMTLILTLVATNKIVQVSDRRLTLNRETCDSSANRLVCVGCDDAHFSIGYTGVAEIDGQRTDYWLVDQISSIFSSGHQDVLAVYKALAEKATSAVSRLRYKGRLVHPQGRGLTLALAGYRVMSETTVPFLAYISNVALDASSPFEVQARFFRKGWIFDPRPSADRQMLYINGAEGAFTAGDKPANTILKQYWETKRSLSKIDLGYRPESRTTAEILAWLVRQATKHPRYGPYIGPDCLSVVLHPDNPGMPTHYHPEKAATIEHMPHLVTPMLAMWDGRTDLDPHIPDLADPNEAVLTTSHRRANDRAQSDEVDPDPLRYTIAHYFATYYQEARNQLAGRSFSIETVPSHLMPWRKLVRTWETRDGHFVVEHVSQSSDSPHPANESGRSDLGEDYMHLYPRRDQTLREMTGVEVDKCALVHSVEIRGKRIGDAGYEEVQNGDYLERVDAISRDKVAELTEEEARETARADMQPYLDLE
jgi:hypothetical protein